MPKVTKRFPKHVGSPRLAAWQKRMEEVDGMTQGLLNEFFRTGSHKHQMRFAEGQAVVCLSRGFYYQAELFMYFKTEVPASHFPDGTQREDVEPEDWIPTVIARFKGYSAKQNDVYCENELISCRASDDLSCHLQGMLFAHEWNLLQRAMKGIESGKLVMGEWFLAPEVYRGLEKHWQEVTGKNVAFAAYCGREATATVPAVQTVDEFPNEDQRPMQPLELSEPAGEGPDDDEFFSF